jgi:hypothetical protein
MDKKIEQSLERIIEYLFWDEIRDWEAAGRPQRDHIYLDVMRVDDWLDKASQRKRAPRRAR